MFLFCFIKQNWLFSFGYKLKKVCMRFKKYIVLLKLNTLCAGVSVYPTGIKYTLPNIYSGSRAESIPYFLWGRPEDANLFWRRRTLKTS